MILRMVSAAYPTFKPQFLEDTVNMWNVMFSDYGFEEVELALKSYIANDVTAFAPSVGQLLEELRKISCEMNGGIPSDAEAWELVKKAMKGSFYNSQETFNNLPNPVKKAIGSPSRLYHMATDNNYNESVEMSLFSKAYRKAVEEEMRMAKMPTEIKRLLGGANNGNDRIGNSERLQIVQKQD